MPTLIRGRFLPVSVVASSLLIVIIAFALNASADPYVPPPPDDTTFRLSDPVSGIVWLLLVNVLVNLCCYSALLLAFTRIHSSERSIVDTSGARFLLLLVGAVFVISLIGAAADFYLVTQPRYIDNIFSAGENISGTYRVVVLDPLNLALALTVIFLSVAITSTILLELRTRTAIMISAGFVAVNIIFWTLTGVLGEDTIFLTVLSGVLLAPILVSFLIRWYTNERPPAIRSSTA